VGSDFLFAVPSTLSGVARTLDLGATFNEYNESKDEATADAKALYADWRTIGETLVEATDTVIKQQSELVKK
jgi:hypothetical protein